MIGLQDFFSLSHSYPNNRSRGKKRNEMIFAACGGACKVKCQKAELAFEKDFLLRDFPITRSPAAFGLV